MINTIAPKCLWGNWGNQHPQERKPTGTGQKWCSTTNVCYRIVRGLLDIVRVLILTVTYRGYPAKKGPTRHGYAWQIRPFWQDTLDIFPPGVRQTVAHITMTSQWVGWRLKSPASQLFTQSFIRAQIKENIKAPHKWPVTRKMFPFDDVITK